MRVVIVKVWFLAPLLQNHRRFLLILQIPDPECLKAETQARESTSSQAFWKILANGKSWEIPAEGMVLTGSHESKKMGVGGDSERGRKERRSLKVFTYQEKRLVLEQEKDHKIERLLGLWSTISMLHLISSAKEETSAGEADLPLTHSMALGYSPDTSLWHQ